MFWVGVSLLVMSLTGLGDDTRAFLRFWQRMQDAAEDQVADPARKAEVTAALGATRKAFEVQRERLEVVADCIERLDRSYQVSRAQYEACVQSESGILDSSAEALIAARARLHAATTESERARIRAQVLGK